MFSKSFPVPILGTVRVLPNIPEALSGLEDLAYNVWWTWNPKARALFRQIHPQTWFSCEGNPVRFLHAVRQADLDAAARDEHVLGLYDDVMSELNDYLSGARSWYKRTQKERKDTLVAYFSAEFGLHESLPIYSGGLGVLAGDHLKSASDIGIPFVAVGLLYRQGYFIQAIDHNGQQKDLYRTLDWYELPIQPAKNGKGELVTVEVELPGRVLKAKVWKVQVGRIPLYLLDADIDANSSEDRQLTQRLYSGGHEMRIQQEILLGIGGVRALRKLKYDPTVFHMNEGHSVFLGLERMREYLHDHGLSFRDALEVVRGTTVFTTHTPVPAGNDAFGPPLIEKYFRSYWESLGLSRAQFFDMGLETTPEGGQVFSLTVLAMHLAAMANGVSELHGHVSRNMWQHIWPQVPADEVPIHHITNGVHSRTWLSLDMQDLFDKHIDKDWRDRLEDPELWEHVDRIPDDELWAVRNKLRHDMVEFIHRRVTRQHQRFGESPSMVREAAAVLNPDTLTLGFARRFATYKRATLIFHDRERLARILNHPTRPMQIVFSGKAHPADQPGQGLIRQIQEISRDPAFHGKIIFIENYDMNVGRRLTSGVDVWLNNPRRPYEASGTSGMKAPLNGGINCSILDGWWAEAYRDNPLSGWALGTENGIHYEDDHQQDAADAESLYNTLETQIAPLFYERDADGIPHKWLRRARESMKTVCPQFSTQRMVEDYSELFYLPGSVRYTTLTSRKFERAKVLAEWKENLRAHWSSLRVKASLKASGNGAHSVRVREKLEIMAEVEPGQVSPDDIEVQIYVAALHQDCHDGNFRGGTIPMHPDGKSDSGGLLYRGSLLEADSGSYGFTVRVVPRHPELIHPNEMGLITWAQVTR